MRAAAFRRVALAVVLAGSTAVGYAQTPQDMASSIDQIKALAAAGRTDEAQALLSKVRARIHALITSQGYAKAGPPVRVGSTVAAPSKIRDVRPAYPPEAVEAKASGSVFIEAVINEEGQVSEATIIKGIPMLDKAALAAVTQWEYTPTLLDGVPVPLVMVLTVTFSSK